MIDNLSPCPFCGSVNLKLSSNTPYLDPTSYFVRCNDCHAEGPSFVDDGVHKQWAMDAAQHGWNERSGQQEQSND